MYTLFLRHLQHVSFLCVREGKRNGKSAPPPTAATWQGRRAVGQEPTGHSLSYLWSAFFSLQSEPLCSPACLCALLLIFFYCLSRTKKKKKNGYTNNKKDTLSPRLLCFSTSFFPRLFILMWVTHEKGSPHLQAWRGRIWPHQQSGSPLPVTHWPEWMTSIHWLPLTLTQWNQGKGEHTYTIYINNGNVCFSYWPDVATTYFFAPMPFSICLTSARHC